MQKQKKDISSPHAQALFECVDKALREAGKLARKRAEVSGVPLVVREQNSKSVMSTTTLQG